MTSAGCGGPGAAWTRRVAAYQRVLEITAPPGRAAMPAAGIGYVGLAEIAYQRNELDDAHRLVTQGIPLCRQLNWTQPLAAGLVTLAWIRQAIGDPGGAREAMAEAERIAPGPGGDGPAQPACRCSGHGCCWPRATSPPCPVGTRQRPSPPATSRTSPGKAGHLVLARVLLAQDQPGPALALLDRLHGAAAAQDRAGQPDRDRRPAGTGAGRQR